MRRRLLTALLVPALSLAGSAARADDTSDLRGLLSEPVVTTASKSAETASVAPGTSTTLTAEDMRRYGMHSLDEAIDFLSLGVVTSNPLHDVDIGARGVMIPNDSGDHFLLLVNGHAVNEPLFGGARFDRGAGIPLEMVDHIEVILGPGSVLYGSNAMLGVINVITKRAKDLQGVHLIVESGAGFGDKSAFGMSTRAAGVGGFTMSLFGRPSELTFGVEYYSQSGPAFKFGPQDGGIDRLTGQPTIFSHDTTGHSYPAPFWGGRATQGYYAQIPSAIIRFVSGNLEINMKATINKRAIPYRARYTAAIADFNDPDSYQIDRSIWFDARYHVTLSPIAELTTRVYGDSFDYQDYQDTTYAGGCLFENVTTCRYGVVGATRWLGAEVQTSFDWLKDATLVTLVGVDERIRSIASKSDARDFGTGRPLESSFGVINHNDKTLGAYLQQTWQPTGWLSLNGGARLDQEDRFHGVLSPRFAASAKTWKGGTLKGVYAEAFRSPSWVETNFSNPLTILARDLRPEHVRSVEGSIEQRFGAHRLMMGVFRSWWTDLVELHVLTQAEQEAAAARGEIDLLHASGIIQFRNVSSIDNYGFNLGYEGSVGDTGQLRFGTNLTGSIAQRNDPGVAPQRLAVAPQAFGNARVSYDLPGDLPTLALASHYIGVRPADRAFDGGFPQTPYAPAQLEVRGAVSGPIPKSIVPGLSYRVSANYAFAAHSPYVVGPTQYYSPPYTTPELAPVERFRVTAGLQWDFGQ
jgi:outer membrane receptor protein involved in Fe transport